MISSRDPQAGTAAVERQYLQLTTVQGREFQTYSINNSIHMVPVDEVGRNSCNHSDMQRTDSKNNRKKPNDSQLNISCSISSLMVDLSFLQWPTSVMSWTVAMGQPRGLLTWQITIPGAQ